MNKYFQPAIIFKYEGTILAEKSIRFVVNADMQITQAIFHRKPSVFKYESLQCSPDECEGKNLFIVLPALWQTEVTYAFNQIQKPRHAILLEMRNYLDVRLTIYPVFKDNHIAHYYVVIEEV